MPCESKTKAPQGVAVEAAGESEGFHNEYSAGGKVGEQDGETVRNLRQGAASTRSATTPALDPPRAGTKE